MERTQRRSPQGPEPVHRQRPQPQQLQGGGRQGRGTRPGQQEGDLGARQGEHLLHQELGDELQVKLMVWSGLTLSFI